MAEEMIFVDLAAYFPSRELLVISDLHIGYEEALNRQGILVPRTNIKESIERLIGIIRVTKPLVIVIAGDLKHEFGTISEQEWKDTLRMIDFLRSDDRRLVLVKGNHDTILGPIAKRRDIVVVDSYIDGRLMIVHGHKLIKPPKDVKMVVIGHEHPALSLHSTSRNESYKCFLRGKWHGNELVVLPSFNLSVEGSDILSERKLSPYLDDIDDFSVFVPDAKEKKVLYFGMVKNLI
ncbi:phosphoesterase [Candidatus Woesearchaeota archaeon CG11_big_fil_rev_8_21_14_0_20_43_8]|nr:MAG: phosphoesterase [Candidatus Woesearchaeota archaeon CG11_big_fil_rev_8_21_14_0_20_43_8]PIO06792.1 MAG: phosphoesterase [Candidatus Woesearchaeota archaeon CG08_land_8_20_14_0_20_43_7]